MKKIIALLLALSCLFALCACGAKEEAAEETTELDLQALSQNIIDKIGVPMPQLNENMLLNMYGLSEEDCAEMLVYSDYDGTKCNELWLIKGASSNGLSNARDMAQNRVDALLMQSNNYNADVYAASQKARIEVRGDYLLLIVTTAGNADEVAQMFLDA